MAKRGPPKDPPPQGLVPNLRRRLGRPAAPGEGQYVVAAYAVVTVILLLSPFISTEVPNPTGEPAPDFSLPATSGGTYHLSPTTLSKAVMVEFMHPQCSHCVAMVDTLTSAYNAYKDQVDFVSVAIPLGSLGQPTMDDVRSFKDAHSHAWTYCLASNDDVAAAYGVSGTPTFFFVGANGTIIASRAGEMSFNELATYLQQIGGG